MYTIWKNVIIVFMLGGVDWQSWPDIQLHIKIDRNTLPVISDY